MILVSFALLGWQGTHQNFKALHPRIEITTTIANVSLFISVPLSL
jgi:hypothetical protein